MIIWECDEKQLGPEARTAFASLASVFALQGERIAKARMSMVIRVELDGRRYYVKRYTGAAKNALRARFGTTRIEAEWENLRRFADWGIRTARVVASGLEREQRRFVRGAMVTAELVDTRDLAAIARSGDVCFRNHRWVRAVSRQIAHDTRCMHAHGFAHNDLKWRNLLVDAADPPQSYWIDCPSGRFWWGPFLRHRVIKDLACLDKLARVHLRRTQRLRFFLDYLGRPTLAAADKRMLRKVLRYFDGRE